MLNTVFKCILIIVFFTAGVGKLVGNEVHIEDFNKWQLPQWFRILTGLVETMGALILFASLWVESLELYGALIFIGIGSGGITTHLRAKESARDSLMIIILFLMSVSLFLFSLYLY